jgi:hypothetical protein
MLTIKIIENDGRETVKEINSVTLRPANESSSGSRCLTYFGFQNNEFYATDVFNGTVYIMNENGKTIANYVLFGEPKVEDCFE